MSSQIKPVLVKDDLLLVDSQINFAVQKGGANVSFQKFTNNSVSSTSHSYTISTPSTAVVMDREVMWHTTMTLRITGTPLPGNFLVNLGDTDCFAPFALHQNVINLQAQINNTSVSNTTQQMLDVLLRNMDDDDLCRYNSMTPVQLDRYGNYADISALSETLATNTAEVYYQLRPVNSPFNDFRGELNPKIPSRGSFKVESISGNTIQATGATELKTVDIVVQITEPLMLSPFVFGSDARKAQGIYGVSQINITAQMDATGKRCFRWIGKGEVGGNKQIASVSYSQTDSYLECRFLTPHPSDLLPEVNILPYANFVNYQNVSNARLQVNDSTEITTNNIQLNGIPDKLFLFVRQKQSLLNPYDADAYCAITGVEVLFDNRTVLSSASPQALYRMSLEAGVKQSWDAFIGKSQRYVAFPTGTDNFDVVSTSGSIVALDWSKHIAISEDYYAPSSLGSFNLSVKIKYTNTTGIATVGNDIGFYPEVNCLVMSSGIFATQNGQSSVYQNVLNKQQVLDASLQTPMGNSELKRYVGGGLFDSLKSIATSVLPMAKGLLSQVNHPLAQTGSNVLGALGFGKGGAMSAGAMSAGAITGGAESGGRRMKNRLA